jgi:hypothetical protein
MQYVFHRDPVDCTVGIFIAGQVSIFIAGQGLPLELQVAALERF